MPAIGKDQPEKMVVPPSEPKDRGEDAAAVAARLIDRVRRAQQYHKADFDRMLHDMVYHRYGALALQSKLPGAVWDVEGQYTANLISPSVRRFVSQVYAKNPKPAVALEDRMDYQVWNGDPLDARYAADMIAQYDEAVAAHEELMKAPPAPLMPPAVDPATGMEIPSSIPPMPQMIEPPAPPPEEAYLIVQEYNDAMQRKEHARQIGKACCKALEKFWNRANFRAQARLGVALARATGVAWMKVSFERKMQLSEARISTIRDHKDRLATIQRLIEMKQAGETDHAQEAELRFLIEDLEANPDEVLEEGLAYEVLPYNRIIVDPDTRDLETMRGCNWIAHVYNMTKNRIQEVFNVSLTIEGKTWATRDGLPGFYDDSAGKLQASEKGSESVYEVYEYHDLKTRMVYVVCDAYEGFLREPTAPKVYFDQGHPFFPLVFDHLVFENQGIYPHSAVYNMRAPQVEYNRSRQGLIENRTHNAPLFAVAKGRLSPEDMNKLATAPAYSVIEVDGINENQKASDLFSRVPTTGVDNNQYDTSPFLDDFSRTGSESEAAMGASTRGSATEASIGAQMMATESGDAASRVDDWLEAIARASGKVLLMEMSRAQMAKIVGRWAEAHWPEGTITEEDVRNDIHLSIVAGSSGAPDTAALANNIERFGSVLLSAPGIRPAWLAKTLGQAISPALDIDEMYDPGLPSIQSLAGQGPFPNAALPADQARAAAMGGANNAPQPAGSPGGRQFPVGSQPGQMQKLRNGI